MTPTAMDHPTPPLISSTMATALNANAPIFIPATVLKATAVEFSLPFRKEFYGAVVEFGPGATVVSIKLPTDSCGIQIKGLCETTPGNVQTVLDILGLSDSTPSIQTSETSTGTVTTVKFHDPNDARRAVEKFAAAQRDSKVTVSHLVTLTKPSEWVQLGGIKCTWEKTGRMAFIEYRRNTPRLGEIATTISQILTPSGRHIKCTLIAANQYETGRALRSFSLNNLDTDADITWVQSTLVSAGFDAPKKVKIQEIGRDGVADDECVKAIQRYLGRLGLVDSFSSGETPDGARKIVTANFCNPADAQKAVADFKSQYPDAFPASKNLTVERLVSMKVNIPRKIAAALDSQIQTLRTSAQQDGKHTFKIVKDDEKPHTIVRFSAVGDDALSAVVEVKTRLEKMMAGTVITDSGVPVWHNWVCSAKDAGDYLHWLSCDTKVYIHRLTEKSRLVLYGGNYAKRRRACTILMTKVQQLKNEAYTTRRVGGKSIAEVLRVLKPVFGEKVRLSLSDRSSKIKLYGSVTDIRKAWHMLNPGTQLKEKDCVVCYDTPEDDNAIHLGCGHIYCRECFTNQFKNPNEYLLPFKCSGLTETQQHCAHRIELGVLREHLSFAEFESVIKLSVDVHLRTHPNDYNFCPTPDCEVIFRRATIEDRDPPLTTCSGCLKTYDAFCGKYHPGQSCKEYLDAIDGTDAFSKYCAAIGIKNCPGCRAPAEKFEGCDHVLCTRCHTHYCWVCLMILPSQGATYNHLTETHGGIGIPDGIPPQYLPQNQVAAANALDQALPPPVFLDVQGFEGFLGNPPEPGIYRFQAPVANMDQLQAIAPGPDLGDIIVDAEAGIRQLQGMINQHR